jgi:hypothetical protein
MTDRYLPVTVWNNRVGQWEPIDFRHEQHIVAWPDGFDLARLPLPDYRDGIACNLCVTRPAPAKGWCGWCSCVAAHTAPWTRSRRS